ncbi:PREDICTED: death-associated protein-like 1 [Thamnophis sirtalis]|uniref:Death-associated protein-like 1 n=1 Tax=Thamnophis sirtalis TaxID=35019 RepID=A0A6I9YFW7_9SAUR|nr:PREDICTED: death-associated protein-like 1 [Thamnophis sirtalis]XP_032077757.1 death-associated protein-like 1 [Thamnophis elegans]
MANLELSPSPFTVKGGRLPAVKAGGMRVSKKPENASDERSSKFHGKEKPSSAPVIKVQSINILLTDTFQKLRYTFPAAAAQGAYEKPRPTVEKIVLPKRMCIIQQPRKC